MRLAGYTHRLTKALTLLSVKGMEQSFEGHDEVDAVKTQLDSLRKGTLPAEVDAQAKTLDAGLNKIGGVMTAGFGGGGPRRVAPDPKAIESFMNLNNAYNTMVSMMQVGLDMAPTPTQVATWQKDCTDLNHTIEAWKDTQKQIVDFNALLTKNSLQEIKVAPIKLTSDTCTFSALEPGRKRNE